MNSISASLPKILKTIVSKNYSIRAIAVRLKHNQQKNETNQLESK